MFNWKLSKFKSGWRRIYVFFSLGIFKLPYLMWTQLRNIEHETRDFEVEVGRKDSYVTLLAMNYNRQTIIRVVV
jgi:hypothetical protein